jgi:hypothetical protein
MEKRKNLLLPAGIGPQFQSNQPQKLNSRMTVPIIYDCELFAMF